jgi:demethylspheroidene O-methyltransferase
VGLRLLARRSGGAVALGSLGAAMIDNPGVSAMVAHHGHLYADLADPVGLLRGGSAEGGKGGRLAGYWPYAGAEAPGALDAEAVGTYSALMAASQPMVAAEVLDAYDFTRHRCLLDVGGGEGAFLQAVAGQAPGLQLRLFDLPAVAARATARFAAAGLAARATATGGDFRADALPQGADIISLVRVAHDHDDATVLALLKACRAALPKGAMLLLAEPMAETEGAETVGAYFAFYLLAMGQGAASRMGRPRSAAELQAMLAQSGFARARLCATATPLVTRVMVAEAE